VKRFEFVSVATLPKLAWCAKVTKQSDCATVHHGLAVETRENRFFEGVWDGPFDQAGFDSAHTFVGTGGAIDGDDFSFATPTNMFERLYSIRASDCLYVSNSLVFALVAAGDTLDPLYPWYNTDDLLNIHREGISRPENSWIHTASGNRLQLHAYANIAVNSKELTVVRREKNRPRVLPMFASYLKLLEGTVARIFENGRAGGRRLRFTPLVPISQGYDSPATAVIASRAGCNEAFSFTNEPGSSEPSDSGRTIAEHLKLQVTERSRWAYKSLPGAPEAEFCAFPDGTNVPAAALEDCFASKIVLSGRHGDVVWSLDPARILPLAQAPHSDSIYGANLIEFRLRVGFVNFPVPYIGALDSDIVHAISTSPEMAPWSIGGDYDRPIPRRIAEEAGVPRDWFGQNKFAGARVSLFDPLDMKREAHAELVRQYKEILHRLETEPVLTHKHSRERVLYKGPPPKPNAFSFSWAVERIRGRYAV
jgi:hypothetical protein